MRRRVLAAILLALPMAGCALVRGPALNDAQQAIADAGIGPSALIVLGAVDRRDHDYRRGERITLLFTVNKPTYVAVLQVRHNGETTLLYPSKDRPKTLVPANTRVEFPVTAGKPGTVLFEFVASTTGTAFVFNTPPKGTAQFAEFGTTTRALAKDLATALNGRHGGESAAAHVVVTVDGD